MKIGRTERIRAAASALLLVAAFSLATALPSLAAEPSLPSGFRDTVAIDGLEEPTTVRFASDGRVFVAEKSGEILVYDSLSDPTPSLFADLRTKVYNAYDRGLLGMALDPQFPSRPFVYVLYAYDAPIGGQAPVWGNPGEDGDDCPDPPGANTDGCVISGRLTRLKAQGNESVGEEVLANDWCQQFSSHSVGDLQFDSEGNLLASGGDGASFTTVDYGQFGYPLTNPCEDPPSGFAGGIQLPPGAEGGALRSQNPESLDGSIVRIDPDTGEGVSGNPLFGSLNQNERRIVAKGFRNPFRFAVDPASDEIYVANVGSSRFEEIDRFEPSSSDLYNSGWPCYEGPKPREPYEAAGLNVCERLYEDPDSVSQPFFYYAGGAGVTPTDPCSYEPGSALSGLAFYEGGSYPAAYDGALFFADSVRGCIYAMQAGEDGRPDPSTAATFLSEGGLYPGVDMEVGPGGDLYYVSLFGDGFGPGAIHRISFDPDSPQARLDADAPTWGDVPLTLEFDAGESTDPQGEPLEYEWDLDGDGSFDAPTDADTATETYEDPSENRKAAVRVLDSQGKQSVAQLTVYPGDTPPVPEIEEPIETLEWSVGQPIHFAGGAEDDEDGALTGTRLYWRSRLYHCPSACHGHPLQVFPAVASGNLIPPAHDLPSHIELSLTATDSRGLSATRAVDVYPRVSRLTLRSDPPGVALSADLETAATPFSFEAIEGTKVQLSAPQSVELGGSTYRWSAWSDGGGREHTVLAKGSPTYTATFSTEAPRAAEPPPARVPPKVAKLRARLQGHPAKRTESKVARFVFSVSRRDFLFRCQLDGGAYRRCRSPQEYRHLKPGWHVFRLLVVDADGHVRGRRAFKWRVL